jgi:AAA domain
MSALKIIKPESPVNTEPVKKPRRTLESYLVNHGDTVGMTWEEIDALRPPYVVDGFGRRGELMLCAAESKSRKSWLVQDLGFCVAIGEPWLAREDGTGGFATAQARVFVFDLELSDGEMRFRFAKARGNRTSDISEQKELTNQFTHYSLEDVQTDDVFYLLEELKCKVSPGDLVIVDCLYRLHPDGNEAKEIASAFTMLKNFAKATQSLVVLVDHFRKAGADKAKDRIAGTFVKSASASTIVAIQTNAEKVLELSIDARTFHGNDKVSCRFNIDNYRFESVAEEYAAPMTVDAFTQHLFDLWQSHDHGATVTKKQAQVKWNLPNLGSADYRLSKMEGMKWLFKRKEGKAWVYSLTGRGLEILQSAKPLALSLALAHDGQAEMLVEYKKK